MSNKEEIEPKATQSKWLKGISIIWFPITLVLLLFTLKPYNKAYVVTNSTAYTFYNQTDSASGYVVDYSGVIDLVAYQNQTAQIELLVHGSAKYKLSLHSKHHKNSNTVVLINGVEQDSLSLKDGKKVKKYTLRKNDYLKVKLKSIDGSTPEIGVKVEMDNASTQREIYSILLIWLLVGLWLMFTFSSHHVLLPSILLLMACYNEHLYPAMDWVLPMFGFIGVTVVLTITRFLLTKSWLGLITRIIVLIYDYFLVLIGLTLGGFIWNYKQYGYRMDYDSVIAVLQTNFAESIEFASSELGFLSVLCVIIFLLLPVFLFFRAKTIEPKTFSRNHILILLISAIVGTALLNESKFIHQFKSAYTQYYEEIAKFNEVQKRFKNQKTFEATKVEKGETYIFVIGESQSKEHMSLYGYHRPTTPFLDSLNSTGGLSVFQNAYSSHTHTIMVLRDALTQSNQYNNLHYTQVPSLINVLNASDFETVWLSNQVKLSNWDNIVSAIAGACNKQIYVNKNVGESMRNSPYDDLLLPELEKILSAPKKQNRAIFIHVLGNHGLYNERYPNSFNGIPSRGAADFGGVKDLPTWEAYDNSILYSDFILKQIHGLLDKAPGKVKLLTYFADHAEDLSEGRGHNSGRFTYRMTQIPMYVWANYGYKTRYSDTWKRVANAESQMFSNDLFFQFALDLTNIQTPLIDDRYNVLSPKYNIDTFKTKSGSIVYKNDENNYTNLDYNAGAIHAWEESGRIGVHRINSLGKLNEVQIHGLKTIELDVKNVDGKLMVGHGEDHMMSGLSLSDYLAEVNLNEIEKIWLDIKNLDPKNLESTLVELIEIDQQFNVKSKLIVETQSKDYNISTIEQQGFRTSFYIPTAILEMTSIEQIEEAVKLAKQLKYQKVGSISFDSKLYDFVKDNLENRIDPNIAYHTWNLDLDIRHGYFIQGINANNYHSDKRVETILVSFPSVFDL